MLARRTLTTLARLALLLALVLVALGWSAPVAAEQGPATGSKATPEVRTGKTMAPPPQAEPTSAAHHRSPGDAPRLSKGNLKRPPRPSGYNTFEAHDWISFSYPPEVRQQVEPLIAEAARARSELSALLGQPVLANVDVRVARTPGEMADLAPPSFPFPKYAAGVAYSQIGLVLLTIHPLHANSNHDLLEIFKHELAHVALHDAVAGAPVPRWFNEGFAVFASGEGSVKRLQTLWSATLADDFQSLRDLERGFPANAVDASVAYAQAADVVRFLLRQQDRERFASMIGRMRNRPGTPGQSFEVALRDAYGTDLSNLEYEWREDVAKRYTFWPVLFSGTVVWGGMIGLFVFAWRRRRKRTQETLDRWAQEEAREDEQRRRAEVAEAPRVHIVLGRGSTPPPEAIRQSRPDGDVPKVEHDGRWHTLH